MRRPPGAPISWAPRLLDPDSQQRCKRSLIAQRIIAITNWSVEGSVSSGLAPAPAIFQSGEMFLDSTRSGGRRCARADALNERAERLPWPRRCHAAGGNVAA